MDPDFNYRGSTVGTACRDGAGGELVEVDCGIGGLPVELDCPPGRSWDGPARGPPRPDILKRRKYMALKEVNNSKISAVTQAADTSPNTSCDEQEIQHGYKIAKVSAAPNQSISKQSIVIQP